MFEYLINGSTRYSEVPAGALYEQAVERLVLRHAEALFPAFIARSCIPRIRSAFGNRQPDLVLISRELDSWALVEVELEEHSAANHVQPQIAVFAHAEIDTTAIGVIREAFKDTFEGSEIDQVLKLRPRVFLVTHGNCQVSDEHLRTLNVEKIDVRIFSGGANDYLMQVRDGTRSHEVLPGTFTQSTRGIFSSIWLYRGPHLEAFPSGTGWVSVEFDVAVERWGITRTGDGYLLKPPHHLENSLNGVRADLAVLESDRTTLKVVRKQD